MKKYLIATLAVLFFTSCLSITKQVPAKTNYSLVFNNKNINKELIKKSIEVEEPKSINSLNTKNIIYSLNKNEVEAYALSVWSDKPSQMLQKLLIESLSSNYELVKSSRIKVKTDFKLQALLLDFKQSIKKDSSFSTFKINLYLTKIQNKQTVFKQFFYTQNSKNKNALSSVEALNLLSNKFLFDAQIWIKKEIQALR